MLVQYSQISVLRITVLTWEHTGDIKRITSGRKPKDLANSIFKYFSTLDQQDVS